MFQKNLSFTRSPIKKKYHIVTDLETKNIKYNWSLNQSLTLAIGCLTTFPNWSLTHLTTDLAGYDD